MDLVILLLTVSGLANAALFLPTPLEMRVAGALSLLFALPGAALIGALLPPRAGITRIERAVLSAGASVATAVVLVWILYLLRLRLSVAELVIADDVVIGLFAVLAFRRMRNAERAASPPRPSRRSLGIMLALVATLAVSLCFNLYRLDYGELLFDEQWAVSNAVEVLLGKADRLFALPKGPAQMILVMWMARLTDSLGEGILRLPSALSGVTAAAAFWLLARMRLRHAPALLLAGVLFGSHAMLVGLSRWVPYQAFVMAMMLLALYCGARAHATRRLTHARSYWLLSAFFIGAGLLGHYDAALVAPSLIWLFLQSHWRKRRVRSVWALALSLIGIVAAIAAPFYVLLARSPAIAQVETQYVGYRIGLDRAPFNHLNEFLGEQWDYSSAYALIVLAPAVVVAALGLWRRTRDARAAPSWADPAFVLCLTLTLITVFQPGLLSVAGVNLSVVPYGLTALMIMRMSRHDAIWSAIVILALTVFGFMGFVIASPTDHYYVGLPPLLLIAVHALSDLAHAGARKIVTRLRPLYHAGLFSAALVWLSLLVSFSYLQNIALYPRRLLAHPEETPVLFSQLASERLIRVPFQLPQRSGWRAVAVMYETGELRGEHNGTTIGNRDWYLNHVWNPPKPRPRYFLVAPAHKPGLERTPAPPDLLETHWLWGTITVDGEPQISIYQLKDGSPPAPRVLAAEAYDEDWRRLATLSRLETYKAEGRDDSAFYAISRELTANGRPGDSVAFSSPAARRVLDEYYTGNLPYLESAANLDVGAYQRVWGVFWGASASPTEKALAGQAYALPGRWFANMRLRLYLAAPDAPLRSAEVRMGDLATLVGVSVLPDYVRPGDWVPVHAIWRAEQASATRYKVFLHVADAAGRPAAQVDDEPAAGVRPTNGWHPGERIEERYAIQLPTTIQPGEYQILAGFYDPGTQTRLPVLAADGMRPANDAVPLGRLTVSVR